MEYTCDLSTWDTETGGSQVQDLLGPQTEAVSQQANKQEMTHKAPEVWIFGSGSWNWVQNYHFFL